MERVWSTLTAALTASLTAALEIVLEIFLSEETAGTPEPTRKYFKLSSYSLEKICQVSKQVKIITKNSV